MSQNLMQSVLAEAGLAIAPLRAINTPAKGVEFFRKLGFEIPAPAFGGALPALATAAGDLIAAGRQLAQATGESAIATALTNMIGKLAAAANPIGQLHPQLQAGAGGVPGINDLPRRLTDFLVLDYFNTQRPQLHAVLHLVGLIEHEPAAAPGQPTRLI